MGRFVEILVDAAQIDLDTGRAVVGACPVDIFVHDEKGRLATVAENEDECILCGRCVDLASGGLVVRRVYGEGREVTPSSGGEDA